MRCPFCKQSESRVLESRTLDNGFTIRRRRECTSCSRRFTTYERVDDVPLWVIKKMAGGNFLTGQASDRHHEGM